MTRLLQRYCSASVDPLEDQDAAADSVRFDVLVRPIDLGQGIAPRDEAVDVEQPARVPVGDARHVLPWMRRPVVRAGDRLLTPREDDGLDRGRVADRRDADDDRRAALP